LAPALFVAGGSAFFTTLFAGAFFAGGFLAVGIVIPGMCIGCAVAGALRAPSASALTAAYKIVFTKFLR
jgi:hypothetical protein